eukprot:4994355-Pyramimonas_sp.AAC.1
MMRFRGDLSVKSRRPKSLRTRLKVKNTRGIFRRGSRGRTQTEAMMRFSRVSSQESCDAISTRRAQSFDARTREHATLP